MSSSVQKNVSQRKQVKSAIERIDTIEQDLPRVVMAVNEALTAQSQRVGELASILEAVVELAGVQAVDVKIKEIADRKVLANLEVAKSRLEQALTSGEVVSANVISERSLIVGREFDAQGEVLFPGRAQLQYAGVKPEFQAQLLGQGFGFTLETGDGGKFEVLEVYDVVDQSAEQAPAPSPANEG